MNYKKTYSITILGTIYSVRFESMTDNKIFAKGSCDAYTDRTSKEIVVSTCEDNNLSNLEDYIKQNVRHEVIHAFLNESGLQSSWIRTIQGHDETSVDWLAIQLPKIVKALREAGLE